MPLISELQTGDIILFSYRTRRAPYLMRFISWWTKCKYSHVGVVIKDPSFGSKPLKGIFLLESSRNESERDIFNGGHRCGVSLISLESRINNFRGKIYVRRLETERNSKFYQVVSKVYQDSKNSDYDLSPIDWVQSAFGCSCIGSQKTNVFWCSAVVGYFFVKLGLLSEETPWSLLWPKDFSSKSQIVWKNCKLNSEELISI